MAGSLVVIATESEALQDQEKAVVAIRDEWEVEYSRFFNRPSLSSTHPSLLPRFPNRKDPLSGTWIPFSSSTASLQLRFHHSNSDSILTVTSADKILEEHYISKLHLTWPQVSCVSGYPDRGSRAVLLSYKDQLGQIQKFGLRFMTIYEAEKFTNSVKESFEGVRVTALQCGNFGSEISSQLEFDPSNESVYRPREEWSPMASADTCAHQMPTGLNYEAAQDSNSQETILNHDVESIFSAFPPSFTSLLKNCCPAIEQAQSTVSEEVDLKVQITRYLEDSSFQDMLNKVEKVISEMGDDLML